MGVSQLLQDRGVINTWKMPQVYLGSSHSGMAYCKSIIGWFGHYGKAWGKSLRKSSLTLSEKVMKNEQKRRRESNPFCSVASSFRNGQGIRKDGGRTANDWITALGGHVNSAHGGEVNQACPACQELMKRVAQTQ